MTGQDGVQAAAAGQDVAEAEGGGGAGEREDTNTSRQARLSSPQAWKVSGLPLETFFDTMVSLPGAHQGRGIATMATSKADFAPSSKPDYQVTTKAEYGTTKAEYQVTTKADYTVSPGPNSAPSTSSKAAPLAGASMNPYHPLAEQCYSAAPLAGKQEKQGAR